MQKYILIILFILSGSIHAQELDPAYHNNEEILEELTSFAEEYPEWMTLDSIGHSAEYRLPIWMAKISDNPDQIEPEAAILLVGQVHAEEVVGIEIVLEIMKQMLDNNEENSFRQRLEGLEIYLIPTANPEGLEIVHNGTDVTFRKNCRDNIGDGELRIVDDAGWDTSGVDLNRNFGLHWDRGDTLFHPEENYCYNAFRGSAPFSEPESQALRDLALQRPFLYSVVYHGSRSGNSAEMLIAPWFWRENNIIKRPPDSDAVNTLGERLAGMMPKQNDPDDHYRPVQSMQRKGQLQDWYYVETGCIQYMAEVGAEIQPDEDGMRQIVEDNLPAVWYMMDLALGLEGLDGFGTLTVIAENAESSEPLDVTVVVNALDHPILKPRKTNSVNGRFDWLLEAGQHDVWIDRWDYEELEWTEIDITNAERTVLEVELEPSDHVDVTFRTRNQVTDQLVPSRVHIKGPGRSRVYAMDRNHETVYDLNLADGIYELALPSRFYLFEVTAEGYVPVVDVIQMTQDAQIEIMMTPAVTAYYEDFASDREWQRRGDGEDWGIVSFDERSCLTESVTGDYPTDAEIWLQLDDIVELDDTTRATMRIIHLPYCEPQDDYQQISWWTNPDELHSKRYSQLRQDWDTLYVSLDSLEAGMLCVRFDVVSDRAIGEDGWLIDEVTIFTEDHESKLSDVNPIPMSFNLYPVFPNPFNSTTTIRYSLPISSYVSLEVYNTLGKRMKKLYNGNQAAGLHTFNLNADDLPSGLYFLRLNSDAKFSTQKIMLIK